MTTQATSVTWRKPRRHRAPVTKNASQTRIAKPAATMKHGQAAETTEESSLIFFVLNHRTASYEAKPAVYKIRS